VQPSGITCVASLPPQLKCVCGDSEVVEHAVHAETGASHWRRSAPPRGDTTTPVYTTPRNIRAPDENNRLRPDRRGLLVQRNDVQLPML
jgi:hypothetical protein